MNSILVVTYKLVLNSPVYYDIDDGNAYYIQLKMWQDLFDNT